MNSLWLQATEWMIRERELLPQIWPQELPPEGSEGFWFAAARSEMKTRRSVSDLLGKLVDGQERSPISPLEGWMIQRRFEWAAQVAFGKVMEGIEPDALLSEVLRWLLIGSWESDGCIGLWNHAEREGKMHPDWGKEWE